MAQQKDNYFYGSTGTQGLPWYEQVGLGLGSGALKIGEGIAELGAGFSDYAFDTNFLEYLEKNYPKINVDDGLGKMIELIVQYGVPYGAAVKIAGKVSKIKDLGKAAKAGGVSGAAAKIGYYGLPAAMSEPIAATSRDLTIGQAFGLYPDEMMERLDPTQYEGRDRAAAQLQQKLLFGLEAGPAVGGMTAFLGPVIKGTAKYGAKAAGPVIRGVGDYVLNPLSKVIASERTGIPQTIKALERGRVAAGEKMGIPEYRKWRMYHTGSTKMKERVLKRFDNILGALRTSGRTPVEVHPIKESGIGYIESSKKTAAVFLDDIEKQAHKLAESLGTTGKTNTKVFVNNMMEDIGKFLTGDRTISSIKHFPRGEIRNAVKGLKVKFDKLKKDLKNVLEPEELDSLFRGDLNRYMSRTFEITKNSKYRVAPRDKLKVAGLFMRMLRRSPEHAGKTREEIKALAEAQVDDLIELAQAEGKSTENIIRESSEFISREFGTVEGFLKPGEDLPKVIRQMLGETKDAKALLLDTVGDMASVVGKTDVFDNIARVGEDAGWFVPGHLAENATDAARIFRAKTGIRRPLVKIEPGPDINKLMGRKVIGGYTTPEIAAALRAETLWSDILLKLPGYKAFLTFKGASQLSKTVLSPTTQIRNVESASMFAMANGHFGKGASLTDSMKIVFRDVFGPDGVIDSARLAEKAAEYRRYGVTNSNIIVREVAAMTDDLLRAHEKGGKIGTTETMLKKLQDQSIMKNMTKIYQSGDDLWKIYGYEFEKSKLLNIIKNGTHIDDAERYFREVFGRRFDKFMPDGRTIKSREEIIREMAAETIKNTYPNYNYVPSLVKNLRRMPLGNFISFPAEMYRTSFNLMKFGLREMRSSDPFVRQSGARKLIGFSSALATGKVAQEMGQTLVGVSNEQMDAMRESFVAPWNKSGPLVPVAKDIKGDKVVYKFVNFAYQSPYDVIAAPYYAAMTQFSQARAEEKDIDEAMFNAFFGSDRAPGAFTQLVQPFMSESILTEKLADLTVRGGKTRSGRKIFSDEHNVGDQIALGVSHVLTGLTPGAFTQVTNFARGVAGEKSKYFKQMNPSDEALALFAGIRINEANVGQSVSYKVNSYLSDQREAKRLLTSEFGAANVNPETIYREYERMLSNKFQNFAEIRKVFDDAEKMGYGRQYILRQLKKRKVSKKDIAVIFSGRFQADDYVKLMKDSRLLKVLKDRNISVNQFINMGRLREIFARYNGRQFTGGF
tara:strand:+ start:4009 stop:7728 length:3720 start_codon:yes stop_codon:yes gene_type:complete